jgi:hypothetical protein
VCRRERRVESISRKGRQDRYPLVGVGAGVDEMPVEEILIG